MNSRSDSEPLPPLLLAAARGASDLQATDVLALDVGDVLGITDWFVVASASNVRQVRRIAEQVEEAVSAIERVMSGQSVNLDDCFGDLVHNEPELPDHLKPLLK